MSGLVQIIITGGVIMIYGSTGLQPSLCPVFSPSLLFVSEDISVMSLQHDRAPPDHHPPHVGHTFAEIPKSAPYPYLFKKSLIYPHLFTLPYILTVKAGPVPG